MGANAGVDSGCRAAKSWPMLVCPTHLNETSFPIGSHPLDGGSIGSGGYEPSLTYKAIGEFFSIRGIHPPNITRDSSEVIKVRSASKKTLTAQHTENIKHNIRNPTLF